MIIPYQESADPNAGLAHVALRSLQSLERMPLARLVFSDVGIKPLQPQKRDSSTTHGLQAI